MDFSCKRFPDVKQPIQNWYAQEECNYLIKKKKKLGWFQLENTLSSKTKYAVAYKNHNDTK